MFEDELLKLRFKAGSVDTLQRIYEKYRDYLLTLVMALVNDGGTAEDVVHDVFVAFAQSGACFRLHVRLRRRSHVHYRRGSKADPDGGSGLSSCADYARRAGIEKASSRIKHPGRRAIM
jgi:hypothetical protein